MPTPHVLIVDDDDVDRERLVRLLERNSLPVKISQADSKASALDALKQGLFDVVFLDFKLQDGDGRDIVGDIHKANKACMVVAVTGGGDEHTASRAIHSGIAEYWTKFNLNAEQVQQTILDGMRMAQIQRQLTEAEHLLQRRSLYDSLTELPNRSLFFDRLEQACLAHASDQTAFAVLMIDLDRFKEVNDTLGHQVGDLVLQEVGRRYNALLRHGDTIARLGGDEFAALILNLDSVEAVLPLAEKLVQALERPIVIQGHTLSVGSSIGLVLCPQHGTDSTTLMACADRAMHTAKHGVHEIVIHESGQASPTRVQSSHALIAELGEAIHNGELLMHYQPKVHLATRAIKGFEALVRWQPPGQAMRPPDTFIPILENSNLLSKFTYKTIDLVLTQVNQWRQQPWDYVVAVNISALMLEDPQFVQHVLLSLQAHEVPASCLILELTETSLVINPIKAQQVIVELQSHGVGLSIDDFGAGFTSFRYLRDFPIAEIKLDRTFVTRLESSTFDTALVRSLGVLCKPLDIDFIAEGIEHTSLWPVLVSLGCELGQGYSIARPMPEGKIPEWIQQWNAQTDLDAQQPTPPPIPH